MWQRLSVRDGKDTDNGPYEGVPRHLYEVLRGWANNEFGVPPYALDYSSKGLKLAAAIHYPVSLGNSGTSVQDVTEALIIAPDKMLDLIDAGLHLFKVNVGPRRQLNELLSLSGSVWQVNPTGSCLVRRVDSAAADAFAEASSPHDLASVELSEAWVSAFGRNPNASDAWDHSIKALETVLIPIVIPTKAKATLGDVVGVLNSQGHRWQLGLHGHDGSQSVTPLVTMLRLIWPNPDRHGGNVRQPSLDEAQAVVHLAVTIVQWARAGSLHKRP